MDNIYLTQREVKRLRDDIATLQAQLMELRKETGEITRSSRQKFGDNGTLEGHILDTNAISKRLNEAHSKLTNSRIIDPPDSAEQVAIGTRVIIDKNGRREIWEITGFDGSEPEKGRIAYNTPLASLIIGRHLNEIVKGVIAKKKTIIKILEISIPASHETPKLEISECMD